jgi:flagellar biosynthesis protein FliP
MTDFSQLFERLNQSSVFENLSPPVQMALMLGALVLLPAVLAGLTSFTRIAIVLSFVRRGMSTQEIPPTPVLLGLSLFLTFFVMGPVWNRMGNEAVLPWMDEEITGVEAIRRGAAIQKEFMLRQTRKNDLALFLHLSQAERPQTPQDTPFLALVPAFMISELKTAFLMGFCIFVPFLMVDLVVATILMGMGMWMMPPIIISTPFKVLLFVIADGWHLVSMTVSYSFG